MLNEKLPRREFLRISTAVVAGAAATGLIPADSLFATAADPAVDPLLAVGYVALAPEVGASVPLQTAADILSGDTAFLSRSALVTITSYSRGLKYRRLPNGHEVDAVFPATSYTPDKFPRFRAWMTVGGDTGEGAPAGSRFTMPVTATVGAQFVVRGLRNDGTTAPPEETLLRLSSGVESRTLKLTRGVYVIAFRESGKDQKPNWPAYRLARGPIGELTIPGAPFSYVLMTIDYAS